MTAHLEEQSVSASRDVAARATDPILLNDLLGLYDLLDETLANLSAKTVETYSARGMEKLGLRSRAALVKFALQEGLIKRD